MEENKQIVLLRETVAQLDLRCRVIGSMVKLMDLAVGKDEFLSRAANLLAEAIHAEVMIAVIDSQTEQFSFYPLKPEDELSGDDTEKREHALKIFASLETSSGSYAAGKGFMCFPIGSGVAARGMIVAFSPDMNEKFPEHEVKLFNEAAALLEKIMEQAVLLADMNGSIIKMQKLLDIVKAFSKVSGFQQFIEDSVRAAADIVDCEAVSVLLLDNEKKVLRFAAVAGDISEKLTGMEFPASEGMAGWALKNGREAIVNEAGDNEHFSSRVDELAGFSTRNLMVAPLGDAVTPLGVIETVNKVNGQDFSSQDMLYLSILASQISQVMKQPPRDAELPETFIETAALLLDTLESGYSPNLKHSRNMLSTARELALAMGQDEKTAKEISLAALLHDIGKIAVPQAILQKPDPLSDKEWELMKKHPATGAAILEKSAGLSALAPYVKYHHEKWDGTGYPEGLKGEAIPLGARIIAVCDAFDAMLCDRNYGRTFTVAAAIEELIINSSKQFDPECVNAAVPIFRKLEEKLL